MDVFLFTLFFWLLCSTILTSTDLSTLSGIFFLFVCTSHFELESIWNSEAQGQMKKDTLNLSGILGSCQNLTEKKIVNVVVTDTGSGIIELISNADKRCCVQLRTNMLE